MNTTSTRKLYGPTGALGIAAANLLESRGLDWELCAKMGIETASAPDGDDTWIALPYRMGGHVVAYKFRRVLKRQGMPNFSATPGAKFSWWNHDALADRSLAGPLIVTEGELDAIAAIQCGFARVVSVPTGAPSRETDSGYGYLADTLPLIDDCREIILAVDGDGPGVALLDDLAKRLGRGRCKRVIYPAGCKDLLDTLAQGQAEVVRVINEAEWLDVPGLYRMGKLVPLAEPEALVTGLPGMGEHLRLRVGDFSVLTGLPGVGKSTIVNDIACRMAEKYGWQTCFASPEQTPQTDHRRALRTWAQHKPEAQQTAEEIAGADGFIDRYFSFVVGCDDQEFDLEWLLDKMASAVIRYDARLLIIDPWNELDHAKPRDQTTTEYVGWAIRQLKKFAKKWHVHVMVVAHPAKVQRNRDGIIPMPTPYDIADSAHWWNKPDVCLVLHKSTDSDGGAYTGLHVVKSRYHDQIGRPGTARLTFVPQTARYEAAS